MGFKRSSAIRHPKGLWLMELWSGQAFRADTTKLRKNVKSSLQRNPLLVEVGRVESWRSTVDFPLGKGDL
jgi:hypothetical protein